MFEQFITSLGFFEDLLWNYLGVPMIMVLGLYLSFRSRFVQIRRFPMVIRNFFVFMMNHDPDKGGVHPIRAFFASVGGATGIGNVVAVCTAVQIGGPGAILWLWIAAVIGMVVKYSELYLGMRFRVERPDGGHNGGPMYYLQHAFKWSWIPGLASLLLGIYGVEIYQFSVMTKSISHNFGLNEVLVVGVMLALVIYAAQGGISRVGSISGWMVPLFFILYFSMGLWIMWKNIGILPQVFANIFTSAFTGTAAVGGAAGGTMLLAMSHGIRRACYTGDLGVGYAAVIHSESRVLQPEKQAALAFVEIFLDSFMLCTMSMMLVVVTGVWSQPIDAHMLVQAALGQYFPYMHYFMPVFLSLLAYSTIIGYFCVGIKCAEYLSPKWGKPFFYAYALIVLPLFSFVDTAAALGVMQIVGGCLLIINLTGMFILRDQIGFNIEAVNLATDLEHVPAKPTSDAVTEAG